jgi:FkbM family methyltransferase
MKNTIKKMLPASVIGLASTVIRKSHHRNYPSVSRYTGSHDAVLQCCISYNQFGAYCVPLSSRHRPAAQKIFSGEVWEPKTIEFMSKHCRGGDIVHAGTYFGDFIPALSRACGAEAKVWAFEPNPENYRCASVTIMINGLRNVELANAGLGSQKGWLSMMVSDESGRALGGASRLIAVENGSQNGQLAKVEIVKIDDVVPANRNIAILQLDVEGFEQAALSGAIATIKRCKPILILENLPEAGWLAENILQLGYKAVEKVHENTVLMIQ